MRHLTVDWPRCQPRRGDVDRQQIERHRTALEAAPGATAVVLYAGAHPPWLGVDFWLDLDSPEVFSDWVDTVLESLGDAAHAWMPIDRPNAFALERYVRGKGRRVRLATGWAIRCLDNMVAAHAIAADRIRSRQADAQVRFSTEAHLEYELDQLSIDLLLHRARGVDQRGLHAHLSTRRDDWYARLPQPSAKQRLVRHYTKSGIPLEQAFPRAQAAVAQCEGRPVDLVELAGLDELSATDRDAYLAATPRDGGVVYEQLDASE